jgi:hypothetical protein
MGEFADFITKLQQPNEKPPEQQPTGRPEFDPRYGDARQVRDEGIAATTRTPAPAPVPPPPPGTYEQALREQVRNSYGSSSFGQFLGRIDEQDLADTRRAQRVYAQQASDEVRETAGTLLGATGSRGEALRVWRGLSPKEREEVMRVAPGLAQEAGTERSGAFGRTWDALGRGISRGVVQPLMELTGTGGTEEEIEAMRQLQGISEEFAPARADDPWYVRGPLQAVEMIPWMATIVGGGGATKELAKKTGLAAWMARGFGKGRMTLQAAEAAGITAAAFPGQYAQELDALKAAGVTEHRKSIAFATAVLTGALEAIVPNPFKVGKVPMNQGAMKAVRKHLAETLKKAPGEWSEEYLQGLASGMGVVAATYLDENAPDQGLGSAFQEAWAQASDAALPLAFMMGVPGGVGAGLTAIQAKRLARLEEVSEKGFVTKDEGEELGLTTSQLKNRNSRFNAVQGERATLEELALQTDELIEETENEQRQRATQALEQVARDLPERMPSETQIPEDARTPIQEDADAQIPTTQTPTDDQAEVPIGEVPATNKMTTGEIVEVATEAINVDPGRFQFKTGASQTTGAVEGEELQGKWDKTAAGVILLWQDNDGKLWAVNGHHRTELAKRKNVTSMAARIVKEEDGVSEDDARAMGAKLNILEEQGKVEDYADFFRNTQIEEEDAKEQGLLARSKGKTGFILGRFASEDVWAGYRAGKLNAAQAAAIADVGRNDDGLQQLGLQLARQNKNAELIRTTLQVHKLTRDRATETQGNLFGFDDSAIQESEKTAAAINKIVKGLKDRVLAVRGYLKRPDEAKALGLKGDVESIQAEVDQLNEELARWEQWTTDPELVQRARVESGLVAEGRDTTEESAAKTPDPDGKYEQMTPNELTALLKGREIPNRSKATSKNKKIELLKKADAEAAKAAESEPSPSGPESEVRAHLENDDADAALQVFKGLRTKKQIDELAREVLGSGFASDTTRKAMIEQLERRVPLSTRSAVQQQAQDDRVSLAQKALKVTQDNRQRHLDGLAGAPVEEELSEDAFHNPHEEPYRTQVAEAWDREVAKREAELAAVIGLAATVPAQVAADVGVPGQQKGLFQTDEQGQLFNVQRPQQKAAGESAERSQLERIQDELSEGQAESLPGQTRLPEQPLGMTEDEFAKASKRVIVVKKYGVGGEGKRFAAVEVDGQRVDVVVRESHKDSEETRVGEIRRLVYRKLQTEEKTKIQIKAEQARHEAVEITKDAFKDIKLYSTPMDPQAIKAASKVIYAWAKAGTLTFVEFLEQLGHTMSRDQIGQLLDVLKFEWDNIQASGDVKGMEPREPESQEAPEPTGTAPDQEAPEPTGTAPEWGGPPIGTKHASTAAQREYLGLPPHAPHEPRTLEDIDAQVAWEMKNDPGIARRLVKELEAKPRTLGPVEEGILKEYLVNLNNAQRAGENRLAEIMRVTDVAFKAGSLWGQAGVVRQAERAADFSLVGLLHRHHQAFGERPTEAQAKRYEEAADNIHEAERERHEQETKEVTEEIDEIIQDEQADVERDKKKQAKKKAKRATKREKQQQRAAEAAKKYRQAKENKDAALKDFDSLFTLQTGVDPTQVKAAAKVIKAYVELGVASFENFMAQLSRDWGETKAEKARPALKEAWDKFERSGNRKQAPAEELVEAYSELGAESALEVVAMMRNDLGDLADDDVKAIQSAWARMNQPTDKPPLEPAALGSLAKSLTRAAIEAGITEREAVIDAVHEALTNAGATVDRWGTMQAMSGYGEYRELSKDDVSVKIREYRGEIHQLLKLHDMEEGKPPRRTGVERQKATKEERKLRKQVNEAKKRAGYTVTDPATQLKSALDTAKTAVTNRLTDVDDEIAKLEQSIVDRTPLTKPPTETTKLQEDAELTKLREDLKERRATRDKLKEEYNKLFPPDRKQRQQSAEEQEKKAAKEIERLEQTLTDIREGRERQKPGKQPDLRSAETISRLKVLRDQIKAAKKAATVAEAARWEDEGGRLKASDQKAREYKRNATKLRRLETSLKKQISEIQEKLNTGDLGPKPKATPVEPTENITQLQERLGELRNALEEARQASPEYQAEQQRKQDRRYIQTLERQLKFWEKRRDAAAEGILPEPRPPRQLSKEMLETRHQVEEMKRQALAEIEAAIRNERTPGQKALGLTGDVMDLQRLISTGGELSAVLRQGAAYTLAYPRQAFPALVDSVAAMLSRQADYAIDDDLKARPNSMDYEVGGLDQTVADGPLSKREETMRSGLASWMAHQKGLAWAPVRWPAEALLAGERAFRTFTNTMRADLFDNMKASVQASRPGTWTEDDAKVIANAANVASGRGRLPWRSDGTLLSRIFFAPRWVWSTAQAAVGQPLWKGDRATRMAIGKVYVRSAIGMAAYMTIRHLVYSLGADDEEHEPTYEWDLRSSNVGKMKVGETRLDSGRGFFQLATLIARVVTGQTKTQTGEIRRIGPGLFGGEDTTEEASYYNEEDVRDALHRFLDTKLAPLPGGVIDYLAGQTVVGEKLDRDPVVRAGQVIGERMLPMTWRDIWEAEQELNLPQGITAATEAFFGVGMATYGPNTTQRKGGEKAEKQIKKDLTNMKWDSPLPSYAEMLPEEVRAKFENKRRQRRGQLLYNGLSKIQPRQNYETDESYVKRLKQLESHETQMRTMLRDISFPEAKQMLLEHYIEHHNGTQTQGSRLQRKRTKSGYIKRSKALIDVYNERQ